MNKQKVVITRSAANPVLFSHEYMCGISKQLDDAVCEPCDKEEYETGICRTNCVRNVCRPYNCIEDYSYIGAHILYIYTRYSA